MPEGDTIFRTAQRLRKVLNNRKITDASGRESAIAAAPLVGRTVQEVEARGKHLLIHLDDGVAIHSHMGMTGSWHIYRKSETWRKPARQAFLALCSNDLKIVCFTPKLIESLTSQSLRRHPYLSRLGPDLLAETIEREEVLRRFRVHQQTPIGEAVMNQTIVSGIGNAYKSEVLFLERINPLLPVRALTDEQLTSLMRSTGKLMNRNLEGFPRRTRFAGDGQRMWVYRRRDKPCFRCGTLIAMRRQGDLGRSTYWCPSCQRQNAT